MRELSSEQRRLLTNVRESLVLRPKEYDQTTYGIGAITCRAPACVAGHLVESEPGLVAKLQARFDNRPRPPAAESPHKIAEEIRKIASTALGMENPPRLFTSTWPIEWLGTDPRKQQRLPEHEARFVPSTAEAVTVIDRILDGEVPNALDPIPKDEFPI